jgi:2-C-methyl-D-erythritol 4-phosphate cytidylyltransferase / 2-C-methyl-D-erythritol 2,4-cyclodiphosphate synthase
VTGGDAAAIVLAAGDGRRLGAGEPKAFVTIGGRSLVALSSAAAAASPAIGSVVAAVPPGLEDRARELLVGIAVPVTVVAGGNSRQASVAAALGAVSDTVQVVICHDAARPFAPPDLFSAVVAAIDDEVDGAIPVVPINDTVKRVAGEMIVGTESREGLALAQTPQAFRLEALMEAHRRAHEASVSFTDDAGVVEWAGYRVAAVQGDPRNFKVTTLMDLARARVRVEGER